MPVGEAIDLVLTLPAGSMYAASKDPYQAWTDERRALADIRDIMRACLRRLGGDRSTISLPSTWRPEDEARARAQREKAKRTQSILTETKW